MAAWVILVLGAAVLGLMWGSLPETWAVHFDLHGHPDGWAQRTVPGVFGPILLGAFIVGFTQLLKPMVRGRKSPWAVTPEARERLAEMDCQSIDTISAAMAASVVAFALVLPLAPRLVPAVVIFMVASIVLATLRIVFLIRATLADLKRDGQVQGLKGFSGIAYNNADDPRLWVPKLSGLGTTLNFAHPWAWPVLIAILAFPVSAILIVLWQVLRQA